MQPPECYQNVASFGLVTYVLTLYDPYSLDIINANILSKFQAAEAKNAASRPEY